MNEKNDPRVTRPERHQMEMRFLSLDQMLSLDHEARLVWRFVNSLDLTPLYEGIVVSSTRAGRSATNPHVLVSLWLLATLEGVGSARELARRCERDIPYMWICGGTGINYHKLSDFRVDHSDFLEKLLIDGVASLLDKGLVSLDTVAQDGMRVRASAGKSSYRRQPALEKHRQQAAEHLAQLEKESQSTSERQAGDARRKAARERAARERLERIEEAAETVKDLRAKREKRKKGTGHQARCSTTDPESRKMKMANGGFNPAYNVQFVSDARARVIVGVRATNEGSDGNEMVPMYEQVVEDYDKSPNYWVVDAAFVTKPAVKHLEEKSTKVIAPVPRAEEAIRNGKDPYQAQPNESKEFGQFRQRMSKQEHKDQLKMRPSQAEFPNAVCRNQGLQQFNVRGLLKAKAVALWHAIAFNFRRMKALAVLN